MTDSRRQTEIDGFGRRLGLGGLELPTEGVVTLELEGVGRMTLENAPDASEDLLVSFDATPEASDAARILASAFERAHWREGAPYDVHIGFHDARLIRTVRLDAPDVTSAELENVLRFFLAQAERDR